MTLENPEMHESTEGGTNLYEHRGDRERNLGMMFGGSIAEALVGAGAVVLAIIGLANLRPEHMAAVSTIAVGAALLLQGIMIEAKSAHLSEMSGTAEVGTGFSAEIVGGTAGIIMGILAWLGIAPTFLISLAVILLGGSLLLGGMTLSRLRTVPLGKMSERAFAFTRGAVETASGTELLVGAVAVILGLLALLGIAPWKLMLVSLLALGVAVLFGGSAVASRFKGIFRQRTPL